VTKLPLLLALALLSSPLHAAAPRKAGALMPAVPAPQSEPLPGDPLQATIYRLPNGLTVYLSPNHQTPRITSRIVVRTGSKNDPKDTTGLAHYLEHMLFKGTSSLGTLDYAKEKPYLDKIDELYDEHFKTTDPKERERLYKEIDAQNLKAVKYEVPNEIAKVYRQLGFKELNAHTSDEETVYEVDMPANRVAAWAALESERFAHPVFRLFQSELEAVYEEKNRSMDNAEHILAEALNRKLYKVHPYGQQTTIGEIEHLKNPSLTKMYAYYRTWYHPNNMAIALSGDFEREPMLKLLEKSFGSWKPAPLPAPKVYPLPPPVGTERVEVKHEAEEKVVIAWPTVPLRHPDSDALMVMDMLVDNSVAGLINLELVQAQKVKAAGSYPSFYNDAGDWEVWAVPKRGQSLEEAETLLLDSVEHLKQGRFTDDDIKAVITSFEVGEKARLESNEARADYMSSSFAHFEPWADTVGRLDRLRRVTKQDVLRVAGKYIGPNRVIAYRRNARQEIPKVVKPGFTKVSIDESRQSRFAAKILAMPAAPIEPRWLLEGRDYETAKLPAGTLYAARNPFNDLFSLTFVFDRGSKQERDLCAALGLLDLSGAGALSADEYKKKLFSLGTSLNYGCGEQESSVSLSGLDKNLWESLELMRQRFETPSVDTGTLANMVEVAIGAHQDTKRDPGAVSGALGEWARRGKDSGVLQELTDKELQALTLPKLLALIRSVPEFEHRTGYVGNRPLGELGRLLDERKTYRKPGAREDVRLLAPKEPRVIFTHRDMVQAHVGLFLADGLYDPARAVDYNFYGSYLGGGMSSVIFQEIREARSLAYAAWGGYGPAQHKGDDNELYAGLECQADKTPDAAALLRQLSLDLPWSPERFTETSRAIEQRYRTDPVQFRSVPGVLMAWEDMGLPPGDPRPERFARSLRYTLDDLKSFSSRFKGRAATVYVLGDRARVGLDELKKLGSFEERTIDDLFPY
jgi:predicted Zn-dependent peptidase